MLAALLVIPSIPIALWFSILFYYHSQAIELAGALRFCMVLVGVIFVINSLDSLIRLYSENIGLTVSRLTGLGYIFTHWGLLFALILLYQFTPLRIEWIGLMVIALYACLYTLVFIRRSHLQQDAANTTSLS